MGQGPLIGLGCFAGMLIMVLVGIPVFIPLMIAAVVGFWIIGGPAFVMVQATNATFNITADYAFAVMPMFVLMGIVAGESGIAEDAYNAAGKWLMKMRGGLLMATIGANAIFGACAGVPTGGTFVFTKVAVPQLNSYGYDQKLSLACIASAAVLVTLIPPSMPIIMTSILVDISIGRGLVAGIIPGIILTILLCVTVSLVGVFSPKSIPMPDANIKITWRDRFGSLKLLWPILFIFILMMGGMYAGVFPPTVGGAIGAAGIIIYAFATRRINWRQLYNAFWESVVLMGQLFPMVIGGMLFARLIALSGLAQGFNDFLVSVQMPALGIMAIILIFYIIMGCIMDLMPIIIITLPIVFPILTGLGYDPYAVVVILLFMGALGSITPPIGMSCIIVAIAAKTDVMEVYRGILPFFFVQLALSIVIIFVPSIATWLPNLLYK